MPRVDSRRWKRTSWMSTICRSLLAIEAVEDHDLVEAVQELGAEGLA